MPVATKGRLAAHVSQATATVGLSPIGDEEGQSLGAKAQSGGFLAEHGLRGLEAVGHIEAELRAGDRPRFAVDVKQPFVERIRADDTWHEADLNVRAIVYQCGAIVAEGVVFHLVGGEYQIAVFHHVEKDGECRSAFEFHDERVARPLAEQPPPLLEPYPIGVCAHAIVGRFVESDDGLRNVDIAAPLADDFPIKTSQAIGPLRIVVRDAIHGLAHEVARITAHDGHLLQEVSVRCQSDGGRLDLRTRSNRIGKECVADVRKLDPIGPEGVSHMERKITVGIGYGADARTWHGDMHRRQHTVRAGIAHRSADGGVRSTFRRIRLRRAAKPHHTGGHKEAPQQNSKNRFSLHDSVSV